MAKIHKVIAIASLAFAATAQASVCAEMGSLAYQIMDNRQTGVPLAGMMKIADGAGEQSKLHKMLILEAYKQPKFQTASYRAEAIAEFSNKWERRCYEVRGVK